MELSHTVIRSAFAQTADEIRTLLKAAISHGCANHAKECAISLVRATRTDIDLTLVEDSKIWSSDAEEEEIASYN